MPDTAAPKSSGLKLVREFFGLTMQEMKAEWMQGGLTEADKAQIVQGLSDGTLTY
ncbi:hypothetical protein [Streptomyces venezuelae]|uniref:hypothetical protein n=1 Tax=Streptomyces venezuelae TaxID=54571 RepID=UPI0016811195|nr:hypothetical protein [Streptomyces venezuelae]